MATIAKLLVALGINAEEYNEGLDQAEQRTHSFGNIVKSATGLAVAGFAVLGSSAVAAGLSGLNFNNSMEMVTAQLNAFTKDGKKSAEILEMIKTRASKTPFAFEEMAKATASLLPAAKASGKGLEELISLAEILAASNPAEGLEGAAFSLKEALSGDFTSIIERFNLPRQRLKELKDQGVPALEAVQIAMKELGLDTDLVTNLSNTASGRWSTFKDTMVGVAATVTKPIFDLISNGLGRVNDYLAANQPLIDAFANTLAGYVQGAINGVAAGINLVVQGFQFVSSLIPIVTQGFNALAAVLNPFIQYFSAIVQDGDALNDWLTEIPTVLQPVIQIIGNYIAVWSNLANTIITVVGLLSGGNIAGAWQALINGLGLVVTSYETYVTSIYTLLSGVGTWLMTNLPIWGQMFVDWITPYIPIALTMLGTFAQSILSWIVAQIAPYTTATQGWLEAFTAWIRQAPEMVLGYLANLGASVVTWITTTAASLASGFVTWYNALFEWVPPAIEQFLTAWPTMLEGFLDWIGSGVGPILAAFGTWLVGILDWIATSAPSILKGLMKWGEEFVAWIAPQIPGMIVALAGLGAAILIWIGQTSFVITKKLVEWGIAFIGWVAENVLPKLPGVLSAIGNMIFEFIVGAAKTALALAAGIGKGIIDGIKNADWGAIGSWISEKVKGLLNAAKAALGISSPSKLFADVIGKNIVLGITTGVESHLPRLNDVVENMALSTVTQARDFIGDMSKAFAGENLKNTAKTAGENALKGMISGLQSKVGEAVAKAKDTAQRIVDAMADKLEIHSPSAVFAREVGAPIMLGIIQGMQKTFPQMLAYIGNAGRRILEETTGIMAQFTRSSGIDVFRNLLDLEKLDPFQPLVDASEALKTAQDQALGISGKLLDVNAEIQALTSTPLSEIGDHVRYNEKLAALYGEQAQLLNEQANAQANLARLGQTQAEMQAKSAQQQMMINQIADNARKQYEAAQQQALAMMQNDAKGALAFFNQRKAQIAELAELEKQRALATTDQQRADLDAQIRLTQAAQQAEQAQQAVQIYIGQQDQRAMGDTDIIKIIEDALRRAGLTVDIRTRTA